MQVYKTEDLIEKGKRIHIFSSPSKGDPLHTHDFIELIYILSGHATEVVDGTSFSVGRGDMIFINWGSSHAFSADETFRYINICFSPEMVGDSIITAENAFSLLSLTAFDELRNEAGGGKISFFGIERQEIEAILQAMLREYTQKAVGWYPILESYLNILITRMLRKAELSVGKDEIGEVWREISDFIDANLRSDLTLSALASKCFYNPSYFSRAFKEKFGMSAAEYITRQRLDVAVRLLKDTDFSVDEIGQEAGFSERSSFYYAFSKYVGGTPSEYREQKSKKFGQKSKNQI